MHQIESSDDTNTTATHSISMNVEENEGNRMSVVNTASEQVKAAAKDKPKEELVSDQHMTFISSPLLQVLYTT